MGAVRRRFGDLDPVAADGGFFVFHCVARHPGTRRGRLPTHHQLRAAGTQEHLPGRRRRIRIELVSDLDSGEGLIEDLHLVKLGAQAVGAARRDGVEGQRHRLGDGAGQFPVHIELGFCGGGDEGEVGPGVQRHRVSRTCASVPVEGAETDPALAGTLVQEDAAGSWPRWSRAPRESQGGVVDRSWRCA